MKAPDEILGASAVPIALPGGVADAAASSGYVIGEADALEAIDLANGRKRWGLHKSTPLLAVGAFLVAAEQVDVGALRFVAYRAENGGRSFASQPWPAGQERIFLAARVAEGRLLVGWLERGAFGPAGVAGARQPPARQQEQFVSVDLQTGAVEHLLGRSLLPELPAPPPGVDVGTLLLDQTGRVRVWRNGDRLAALTTEDGALVLRSWPESGGPPTSASLLPSVPAAGYLRNFRPPDGSHVYLALCNDRPQGKAPVGTRCRWAIFEVATGIEVGHPPFEPGGLVDPQPALLDRRFFIATAGKASVVRGSMPRLLRAIDIGRGKTLWEHPLSGSPTASPVPAQDLRTLRTAAS
jgi:hypothetical protein